MPNRVTPKMNFLKRLLIYLIEHILTEEEARELNDLAERLLGMRRKG